MIRYINSNPTMQQAREGASKVSSGIGMDSHKISAERQSNSGTANDVMPDRPGICLLQLIKSRSLNKYAFNDFHNKQSKELLICYIFLSMHIFDHYLLNTRTITQTSSCNNITVYSRFFSAIMTQNTYHDLLLPLILLFCVGPPPCYPSYHPSFRLPVVASIPQYPPYECCCYIYNTSP